MPGAGKLSAMDKTAMTFTVETKNTKEVYGVSSDTKFFKQDNGKEAPATLSDGTVGEEVTGTYKKEGEKRTAVSVYWGGKVKAPKKKKTEDATTAAPAPTTPK